MKATLPGDIVPVNIKASSEIIDGVNLLSDKLNIILSSEGVIINTQKGDNLSVEKKNNEFIITYCIMPEFFRGLAICVEAIRKEIFTPVYEQRQFKTCGPMIDVSSGCAFTVDTLKDIISYSAIMGLNMVMLYIEDIYEMPEYPMFGYMRGVYSKEELKELDSFAFSLGIELVPAIQTLSHLKGTLKWNYARNFRNTLQTLFVGKKETYDFIEAMFKNISECFTSKKINVGLDEAKDMTEGDFRIQNGETDAFELMIEHTNKVCEIAKKYEFNPMMWSDMFYKFGRLGGDYDYTSEVPEGTAEKLSNDMELIYWDYCYDDYKTTEHFINRHKDDLGRTPVFAGGIWTWYRIVPNYQKTFSTANSQLAACKANGVQDIIATTWGRFNPYAILPGLQIYAEHFYNKEVDNAKFEKMFEICTSYRLNDFLAIGLDDFKKEDIDKYKATNAFCINASTQHFFNDILIGLYDKTLSGFDFKSHYTKYVTYFESMGDMGKMKLVFDEVLCLVKILEIKSYIGPELRKAYKENNIEKLTELCTDLKILSQLYKQYLCFTRENWFKTSKAFGWETVEHKLAGMVSRTETALYRVEAYLSGKIKNIDEFDCDVEYYQECESPLTETLDLDSISRAYIR